MELVEYISICSYYIGQGSIKDTDLNGGKHFSELNRL